MRAPTIALLVLLAVSRPGHADDLEDDDERTDDAGLDLRVDPDVIGGASLVAARPPPVAEVLEAAYDAAGLARDPAPSWSRRARIAGLIPWVSVKTGWDARWQDDEPGEVGRSRTFEVRATWRLDRLVFDGRELQISTIDAARRRERRKLASRVIRAYFAWRKVSVLAARDPKFALTLEAATAELDALTDGWFSDRAKPVK